MSSSTSGPRAGRKPSTARKASGATSQGRRSGANTPAKRRSVSGAGSRRQSRASRRSQSAGVSPRAGSDAAVGEGSMSISAELGPPPPASDFSPLGRHTEIPPLPQGSQGDLASRASLGSRPHSPMEASGSSRPSSVTPKTTGKNEQTPVGVSLPALPVSPAAAKDKDSRCASILDPAPVQDAPVPADAASVSTAPPPVTVEPKAASRPGSGAQPAAAARPASSGAPARGTAVGGGTKAVAVLRSERYFASKEERRKAKQTTLFTDFDDDGNEVVDLAEATNLFVEQVGGSDIDALDPEDVFASKTLKQVTLEQFTNHNVYDNLRELHKEHAQEDYDTLMAYRDSWAQFQKLAPELLPRRLFAHVVAFLDIEALWTLTHCATKMRAVPSMDRFWQPLVLRRKKQELMQTVKTTNMLPEVLPKKDFFKWYKALKKEQSASAGRQQWGRRVKEELVTESSEVLKTEHLPTKIVLLHPKPPPPPTDLEESGAVSDAPAAPDDAPPPPPPPELPTLIHGDAKGDVEVRSLNNISHIIHSLHEHDNEITCVASSPSFVHLGAGDSTITVWNRASFARPEFILIAHKEAVSCLEPAPWNEYCLVSGSMDRNVIIWQPLEAAPRKKSIVGKSAESDIPQIQPKVVCNGHTMKVQQIILREHALYSASRDSTVIVWNWEGRLMQKITGHMGPVNCIGFFLDWFAPKEKEDEKEQSEDASAASRRDSQARRASHVSHLSVGSARSGASFDATRALDAYKTDLLVSCCGGGLVKGWNAAGRQQFTKRVHESPIELMHVCQDPRLRGTILTAGWDNLIMMFNVTTESIVMQFNGHLGCIRSMVVDEERGRLLSGSDDSNIGMWRFDDVDPRVARRDPVENTPYYMLSASKSSVQELTLATEADGRWYSLTARSQDYSLFTWKFLPSSKLQNSGLSFG